jgi:hypothetical protein
MTSPPVRSPAAACSRPGSRPRALRRAEVIGQYKIDELLGRTGEYGAIAREGDAGARHRS